MPRQPLSTGLLRSRGAVLRHLRGSRRDRAVARVSALACLLAAPPLLAVPVSVERIDGTTAQGVWIGAEAAFIRLGVDDAIETFPTDELSAIRFEHGSTEAGEGKHRIPDNWLDSTDRPGGNAVTRLDNGDVAFPAEFLLNDSGRLRGFVLMDAPAESIHTHSIVGSRQPIPFDAIAGIRLAAAKQFVRAEELFQAALADRQPAQDVLITRDRDEPKLLRGILESIDATSGAFHFGDRSRTFRTDRTYGIVLAAGAAKEAPRPRPVTLLLRDGSRVSGAIEQADEDEISIATSLGFSARLHLDDLTQITVHSDRLVSLSSLVPDRQEGDGLLHRTWPMERDQNLFGGALNLGGRSFEKGICVHSRTKLVYVINGEFEKLAATIGIDDSVRPLGNVEFRVLGDGKVLWESGIVTGADPPKDIVVPLSGVTEVTLIVDFGKALDLGDHAVWGNARLIRPPSRSSGPS